MHKKFNKGDELSIEQKFEKRKKLIDPFLKKYGQPVLVHSTPNSSLFKKIITERKLKVPKNKEDKEHLFIEKMLNIYPSIFFSLGFVYSTSYDFKYSLIFKISLLEKAKYFQKSIGFQCYREAFRYWEINNPEYITQLSDKNKTCKKVIDTYYNREYGGKKKIIFEFWKIEKELIELIDNYPKKKELLEIFKRIQKGQNISFPESIKIAKIDCLEEYAPEIIIDKDISLKYNKNFLGFYIKGKIPKAINQELKKNYSDKIIFDGKKIKTVSELLSYS